MEIPYLTINCSITFKRRESLFGRICRGVFGGGHYGDQNREEFRLSLRATLIKDFKRYSHVREIIPPILRVGAAADDGWQSVKMI